MIFTHLGVENIAIEWEDSIVREQQEEVFEGLALRAIPLSACRALD